MAALDLEQGDAQAVAKRLTTVDPALMPFRWQRSRYQQTLGNAFWRAGDIPAAGAAYAAAKSVSEEKAEARDRVRERVKELKQILDSTDYQPPTQEELWTSRPLRVCILIDDGKNSALAEEFGFPSMLPWMLGQALSDLPPLQVVDRQLIEEVLNEQSLAAQLGSGAGRAHLGQVLGARFFLNCSFNKAFNQDHLLAKLVDVETTQGIPLKSQTITKDASPDEVVDYLAVEIAEALAARYPLRGILKNGENGSSNLT